MLHSLTSRTDPSRAAEPGRLIPKPKIPVSAVLSYKTFIGKHKTIENYALRNGRKILLTSGRMAIASAARFLCRRSGRKVLVPSYHCAAMIDPLVAMKLKPVFYCLNSDLTVDMDDINERLDDDVIALMVVNYFGFPNNLEELRDTCRSRGITLIEDCAHSMFGSLNGKTIGSYGDFSIFSFTKFYPLIDGGCLLINRRDYWDEFSFFTAEQNFLSQIVQVKNLVNEAVFYDRISMVYPVVVSAYYLRKLINGILAVFIQEKNEENGFVDRGEKSVNPALIRGGEPGIFQEDWMDVAPTFFSRAIVTLASQSRITSKRQTHYKRYCEAFKDHELCRPLFPQLPKGVVPYMFPLIIDDLFTIFPVLEDKGVPMQRFGQFPWPGIENIPCKNSVYYSNRLIQLPCHQELRELEIEEIISDVIESVDVNK